MKPESLEEIRQNNSDYFTGLRRALERGILTSDETLEKCTLKKEQIIREHEKSHKIFQASDNRWKTHLPDGSPKGKLVAKKNREDLDEAIVAFYTEQEKGKYTFRSLYPEYKREKQDLEKLADASIERYQNSWDLLIRSDAKIVDTDVRELTRGQYKTWAMEYLNDHPMAKKSFDSVQIVLKGIVRYAADRDYINGNILSDIRIPANCFIKPEPDPKKEPFNDDEIIRLAQYLWEKYESKPSYTVPLAILFLFQTGLRPAEAVALRFSDIDKDNYLHIQRHRAKTYGNDGKLSKSEIKDTVKTKSRQKPIYLSEEARSILELVKKANEENGDVNDDYIFYNNHENLTTAAINRCLNTACKKTEILPRCAYMIRKTYCSVLADAGISLTILTTMMGHAEPSTTLRFYVKDRNSRKETSETVERALRENMPSRASVTPRRKKRKSRKPLKFETFH